MSENKFDNEFQEKIQELQLLEQQLQNFSLQKQAFQMELNETDSALEETDKSEDDIYKIVGSIMIKAKKQELLKEMKEKKEILSLRLKSLDNHEKNLREKAENIKNYIEDKLKNKKK